MQLELTKRLSSNYAHNALEKTIEEHIQKANYN